MPDSLRFFGGKLAAPEKRSFRANEALGKVSQGKNTGTDREKCSITSDRTTHRFARRKSIEATAKNTGVTLILALSYGGRLEIIDGIKSLLRAIELGHIDKGMIDVEMFSKHLYTRYYPDPDLLIRTSGEMRLSNFLLWQLSYTEMYVTQKMWPDFTKKDLFAAMEEYGRRQRRYGAVE